MIDIPLGKALVPVEKITPGCVGCIFCIYNVFDKRHNRSLACMPKDRKDGKRVIFRLVDWPGEEKQ